jgi:hypothetical protein
LLAVVIRCQRNGVQHVVGAGDFQVV